MSKDLLNEMELLLKSFGTDLDGIFQVQKDMEAKFGKPPHPTLVTELQKDVAKIRKASK